MSIEIPDWVVQLAVDAYAKVNEECGEAVEYFPDAMTEALRAALDGWLEPAGFQHRYNRPLPDGTSCRWFESSESDLEKIRNSYSDQYDLRTLYTLRQEKPE